MTRMVLGAEPERFTFPFAAIPKGAKVIIYGGGIVGKTYVQEIWRTGHCEIIAVVDKDPEKVGIMGVNVISPLNIINYRYDLVLIALERQDLAVDVWKSLCSLGVNRGKLYWFTPTKRVK